MYRTLRFPIRQLTSNNRISMILVPGRPTIWIIVGQGPTALAVGAGGGCLDIFSVVYHFSFLTPSLWETEILSQRAVKPKSTNQPTKILIHLQMKATSDWMRSKFAD